MINTSTVCIMLTIVVYLVGMLFVGIYFTKKNNSTSDFYLGGRTLGPLVTAMSAEASDMSGYLLMGLPGLAYLSGLADVGWTVIGLAAGTYYLQETEAPDGYSVNTTIFKVVIEAEYYSKEEAANVEGIDEGMLKSWTVKVGEGINADGDALKLVASFNVNNEGQTKNIGGTEIKNTSISSLPSTGGIGTTIFTIGGCGIMIAAAGLFFASRRKENR